MNRFILSICLALGAPALLFAQANQADSVFLHSIYTQELLHGHCYPLLHDLTSQYPHRLSGSQGANDAAQFMLQQMKQAGFDSVWLQECMVPHWERGNVEDAGIVTAPGSAPDKMKICALGGSVATPTGGITASIVEADGLDAVKQMGAAQIKGKIVFYNEPFDVTLFNTFEQYGKAVGQRFSGAMLAARYGAVAVVVRSMTNLHDNSPHTGAMGYNDSIPKIPACAICTNDADRLSARLKTNPGLQFFLALNCQTLPDVKSYNVIGEIKGSVDRQVLVVGGHLDCWDKGVGAQDDGAGVVQSVEVLSLMKALGYHPRHTIRVVCFMNEENGGRGGKAYADWVKATGEPHLLALESDRGGLSPRGFEFSTDAATMTTIKSWRTLFTPYDCDHWEYSGDGGSDVGHLKQECKMLSGLLPDSQRYFDYHHSENDVFANVDARELELGAASIAALVYLLDRYL